MITRVLLLHVMKNADNSEATVIYAKYVDFNG